MCQSFHLSTAAFCSRKQSSINIFNMCSSKLVFLKKMLVAKNLKQFCHFPEHLLGTALSSAMPNSSVCKAGNLETLPLVNSYFTHSSIRLIISSRFPEAGWGGCVCVRGSLYPAFPCICNYTDMSHFCFC